MTQPLLEAQRLSVAFGPADAPVRAVAEIDLAVGAGEIIGIAGESGSGKSTLCSALLRALPRAARLEGRVNFAGLDLYQRTARELRQLRRHDLAMVLQNPMTSLDPLFTIGDQMMEVLRARTPAASRSELRDATLQALQRVHLSAAGMRMRQYPHELSGGMKQRVLIAMAAASSPRILVADEPTSALDATIQEEILLLLREVRDRFGTAVVIVSHDLGAIRRVCDRTIVMYAGRIVEDGPTPEVFGAPRHPYTRALIASLPHLEDDEIVLAAIPGQVPDLASLGPGCAFAPRCGSALPRCHAERPDGTGSAPGHLVHCWLEQAR
jgi:oligopeptide/dipeptide ABC transporter ATP-binding protein